MADAHKNFAYSTVATAPSPATSGTSLVVQAGDGTKFPTAPFNAILWPVGTQPLTSNAEIVRVTAISTDTLTITRGATSGGGLNGEPNNQNRSVIIGDQIAAGITVRSLTDIENSTVTVGSTAISLGGTAATLAGVTLTTPTIASFTNATHNHTNAAGGGQITDAALSAAVSIAKGGTGQTTVAAALGGSGLNIESRQTFSNAAYPANATDRYIGQIGTMSAPRNLTLPAAATSGAGYLIMIADESGSVTATNKINLVASGADTINGGSSIISAYGFKALRSDGTSKWTVVAQSIEGDTNLENIIRANTLDQMGVPAAATDWNAKKITNMGEGTADTDAATVAESAYDSTYGDGSDGDVSFDGTTVTFGITPSSGIYALTRDVFFNNLTLTGNASINTLGYRICVKGKLESSSSITATTIICASPFQNGGSFSAGTAGLGLGATTTSAGKSGGTGATGVSAAGTASVDALGGAGGAGGNGTSGSGAAGGSITAPLVTSGSVRNMPTAFQAALQSATKAFTPIVGGASGASGAGDGTNKGGAGGAGGQVLVVAAKFIVATSTITLAANGGSGESPAAGNTGGGGGGGGGLVIFISKHTSSVSTSVAGGTKGTKHGTGTDGVNGSVGTVILIKG